MNFIKPFARRMRSLYKIILSDTITHENVHVAIIISFVCSNQIEKKLEIKWQRMATGEAFRQFLLFDVFIEGYSHFAHYILQLFIILSSEMSKN